MRISPREAAKVLGVTEKVLGHWRRDGRLPKGSFFRYSDRKFVYDKRLIEQHAETFRVGKAS